MLYEQNFQFLESLIICNLLALGAGIISIVIWKYLIKKGLITKPPMSYATILLMLCYFVSVAAITIIPLPFSETFKTSTINLVPMVNTFEDLFAQEKRQSRLLAKDVLQNIVGNVVMFIPLGIFLPITDKRMANYKRVFVFALAASMLIEIAQYFSRFINNYRQVDIDDVILNTLGAVTGYFIYDSWLALKQTGKERQAEFN